MKKHFNKGLVTTNKCWICDNTNVDGDVKVQNHCHITGKQISLSGRSTTLA